MLKPTVYLRPARRPRKVGVHPTQPTQPTQPPHPPQPTLTTGPDGRIRVESGGRTSSVVVRRCFPWSEPAKFISLRDDENVEVALVEDPARLDPRSRQVLESALAAAGFVFEVTRVCSIEEEIEIRSWKVETRQGPRSFQTRLDDWPRELPGGGILIRDVAGDLYHLPATGQLDAKSRELMHAFVD